MSRISQKCLQCTPYVLTVVRSYQCITHIMLQYIPRNMHTVFALLCFVVVIHWLIFPYPSGLLHWHCGNLTIAPVPAKQPWWISINTSYEFIMNDCITTTKQSTTKPCAYFLGYTVHWTEILISRERNGHEGHVSAPHIDGLVQERRNSSALEMELRLSCINPSIWTPT